MQMVGVEEVLNILRVDMATLKVLIAHSQGFPRPYQYLARGPIWTMHDVKEYVRHGVHARSATLRAAN